MPQDDQLLLQRGGSFIIDDDAVVLSHKDKGILGYAKPDRLTKLALAENPAEAPSFEQCLEIVHGAAERKVEDPKEIYLAVRALEKRKKEVCWRAAVCVCQSLTETARLVSQGAQEGGGGGWR